MPTKCYLCLDTKYIYKRYLHNSHLESQPNIISTVLMHLLRISLFVKLKCSEPNQAMVYVQEITLWPQVGSHLAPRCSAAVHIALFGTLLLGLSIHSAIFCTLHMHCTLRFTLQCLGHCTLHCSALSCPDSPWADCPLARCPQGHRVPGHLRRLDLSRQVCADAGEGGEIELSEILPPDLPVLGILPQYMKPGGMSLGLRKSTLGLCLLGCDLYGNLSVLLRASKEV